MKGVPTVLYYCLCNYGYRKHPRQMCVLISGPTGVGKTAVAKAVARACRVHLLPVSIKILLYCFIT